MSLDITFHRLLAKKIDEEKLAKLAELRVADTWEDSRKAAGYLDALEWLADQAADIESKMLQR